MINAKNWYWIVANSTTEIYSSATNTYVPVTDATYEAWLASFGGAKPPAVASETELWNVLQTYGVSLASWLYNGTTFSRPSPTTYTAAQLIAYAEQKQTAIAQGGFTVNANASGAALNVAVSTTPAYANYLSSAVQLAELMVAGTIATSNINWVQASGNVALTPQQVINVGVAVAALVQGSFTVLGQVIAAIEAGTITATAQVDTPPSPIPAWPVNS